MRQDVMYRRCLNEDSTSFIPWLLVSQCQAWSVRLCAGVVGLPWELFSWDMTCDAFCISNSARHCDALVLSPYPAG